MPAEEAGDLASVPAAPAEPAPESDAPAPEPATPAESAPAESEPAESASAASAPAESAPAESAPAESVPAESAPAESAPAASAPAESVPAESEPAESAPAASAAPAHPVPSPASFAARPKAPTPSPASGRPRAAVPVAPAHALSTNLAEAAKWGRAEDDGHVFLLLEGEEVAVGQYPGATKDEALAYFARKFEDIVAQITLLEQRVEAKAPTTDMRKTIKHLREQLSERKSVGDVHGAERRLDALEGRIANLEAAERAGHDAARAAELKSREAIVAEAEHIAGEDPASIQWKTSSARMNELFEFWKTAQKSGLRLGRSTEDALWKRFRSARTVFDRHRRAYFSQLDSTNSAAKAAKEKLIAEAEELSSSTDWGFAAGEYRRLMDQWKASPRASRKDDDALWARFRGAQDKFFAARQSINAALDEEFSANLVVKEALVAEAQSLLPIKDLGAAKKALQPIRDRWEEAGKVPRADMQRIEAGLRQVEDAVRKAEEESWRRSDPEAKARTNSALTQLESTIASLKADLAKAESAGDQRKVRDAREALEAREQWFDQIQKAASDFD
ncbi:DUF349 domain-containing protein [Paenarthrobacter sp. Z7-10]|uniref:DUF349 domain-containing protein n=1 Tax=Paenarthrobacter sp. Z7-10 TaxID=2787635 RepID=UPI003FA76E9C|nr:DUF349 domain-containing protein [Paenarthrobacter sp. Z7-10]